MSGGEGNTRAAGETVQPENEPLLTYLTATFQSGSHRGPILQERSLMQSPEELPRPKAELQGAKVGGGWGLTCSHDVLASPKAHRGTGNWRGGHF